MGDMKTPDFDDLLAAFDIPDATSLDAKEAIQDSHDEAEGHLKHTGMCMDDTGSVPHAVTATTDVPAVSVIVKNTSRQESFEHGVEKESPHLGHLLQNGFRNSGSSLETQVGHSSFPRLNTSPINGDCSRGLLEKVPVLFKSEKNSSILKSVPEFSPISSPESDEMLSNGMDDRPKHEEGPYFPQDTLFESADITDMSDNHRKPETHKTIDKFNERDLSSETVNILNRNSTSVPQENVECFSRDHGEKTGPLSNNPICSLENNYSNAETKKYLTLETNTSPSPPCVKKASKLSTCLDALAALNAKKDPSEQTNVRDLGPAPLKASPKVPISPRSPRSPLEAVKRLIKQPDSPMSMCSDSSSKGSPALATGSPPAIPRVRIKTIKTSSGQIKRTVTSVLPDSETEDLQSPFGSSPSQSSVDEVCSKVLPMYRPQDVVSDVVFENGRRDAPRAAQLGTAPTKAKTAGGSKKAPMQNVSGNLKRTQRGQRQRKVLSNQAGSATNTSYLPKALHLANLNLVPHSVAASVTARSSSHGPSESQLSSSVVCNTVPLVHQVKKALPNTHAVLPNTAAGTLSRLLNHSNPVPPYVPDLKPPPESNIKLPSNGYCCLECGDSFGLEKSLAYHYSRKSVHIEVTCTHCSKTLVFFNKCALLAHAREHKSKGIIMQCTQLFMKPIAVDQMFTPIRQERPAPSRNSQTRSSVQSAKGQAAQPLARHGLRCLECNKPMRDHTALAGHFQRLAGDAEVLMCRPCSMLLPNKCSYRAHQRIHTHKSPYCCPECGLISRSTDIQKHVKENCLHYSRKVGYSCRHCDKLYMSLPLLKSHIEQKHCDVFYKCSVCPVAFKTTDGCQTHIKNKHGAMETSPLVIYKCSCETVFKKKQLLFQHFHQRACLFKCPECTSVFTQKLELMQHFRDAHSGVFRGEAEKGSRHTQTVSVSQHQETMPASCPPKANKPISGANRGERDSSTATQKSSSGVNMRNAGWTCGECLLWLPDRETYVNHMKTSHSRLVKRHPCRQCDRSFNSSTSLRRHVRHNHDGKKRVYTCWYCTDEKVTFTKHFMLKNHMSLMHGIKNPDLSLMAKFAPQEPGSAVAQGSKRRAEDAQGGGDGGGTADAPLVKRLRPHFRCSKCGYTTENKAQFLEHIPQHKTDSDTPQCQNCGLCFTSQLALNRHLFIVHKVKEPEDEEVEEEEEEEEEEDDEEDLDERKDLEPRQGIPEDTCKKNELEPAVEKHGPSTVACPSRPAAEVCSNTVDREFSDSAHTQTPDTSGREKSE